MSAPTNRGVEVAAPEAEPEALRRRERNMLLWRAQRMAFWVLYDHLGRFIVLNILSMTVLFASLWIFQKLVGPEPVPMFLGVAVLLTLLASGQASLVNALLAGEAFSTRRLVEGVWRFGLPALVLGALIGFAIVASLLGIRFYNTMVAVEHPLMGAIGAQVCAATGVFALMAGFYVLPAMLAPESGPLCAIRTSLTLVVRHPVISVGFIVTAGLCAVVMMTPPGIVLLSTWPLATLSCCSYELLARHHNDGPSKTDGEDEYLNRGFREFLFPWKG